MAAGGVAAQHSSPVAQAPNRASGLLAKLNFMRPSSEVSPPMDDDKGHEPDHEDEQDDPPTSASGSGSLATAIHHQHRTRRRRGSLRKVALLGRGAQRDRRDSSPLAVDTTTAAAPAADTEEWSTDATPRAKNQYNALGLKDVDLTPRDYKGREVGQASFGATRISSDLDAALETDRDNSMLYHSTTDEEEGLQLPSRPDTLPLSSGSESYFPSIPSAQRRRPSFQQTKSPLSYSGLSTAPLQPPDTEVDYSETEWWGWIILIVTWLVFVVGMGSCLGVWSWAWDVGKTPYAPPELEDDPTLPIVGYYPALIILTAVMAWVWVVVAWVGMKYFRHAKISGD